MASGTACPGWPQKEARRGAQQKGKVQSDRARPKKRMKEKRSQESRELRSLKQNLNWFSSKQTQWLSILSKNKQNKETPGQHSLTPSSRSSTPTRPNFHTNVSNSEAFQRADLLDCAHCSYCGRSPPCAP